MPKNLRGFPRFVVVIVILTIVILGVVVWRAYTTQQDFENPSGPPNNVESAADAFIISKVGNANFNKYFVFDKSRSGYADPKESAYDFIAYHFSPLKNITGTDYDDIIMVQVNRDNLKEVLSDSVPDCKKEKSYCDFNIDKEEALSIAKTNSLSASDAAVNWNNGNNGYAKAKGLALVILVSSCSQDKSLFIDYRDGSVLGTETAHCGTN